MKFVDSTFLVALLNPKDQWHSLARSVAGPLDEPLLTTMWVLVEVGDALSIGNNRDLFVRFIDRLSAQPQWEMVAASPEWFERGLELFRARADKEWSLTDCISFAVMKQRGITEALTHDHHFEQAGFRILLKD
jgi:predicted nucleic acid-binding protein